MNELDKPLTTEELRQWEEMKSKPLSKISYVFALQFYEFAKAGNYSFIDLEVAHHAVEFLRVLAKAKHHEYLERLEKNNPFKPESVTQEKDLGQPHGS